MYIMMEYRYNILIIFSQNIFFFTVLLLKLVFLNPFPSQIGTLFKNKTMGDHSPVLSKIK